MTIALIELSEIERDALTELVNIGVGWAAVALEKMAGVEVVLSVPSVEIVDRKAAIALIGEQENDELVAVRQDFSGAFSGQALLIFPQANSLELVRAVVGKDMPADEVAGMEHEALAETGNIILNGCLGTIANLLQQSLSMSLPEVLRGNRERLFEFEGYSGDDGLVLLLYINFSMRNRDIRGYIALVMDSPSLAALKVVIDDFISRMMNVHAHIASNGDRADRSSARNDAR
ncbi:MAG: chemotaxis protein CheX [Rhodospirillales bacterium]|nr:chemotaxis protein CheX [Rhodospirillales bacterium]